MTGHELKRVLSMLSKGEIPVVENLDAKILAAVEGESATGRLEMSSWHGDDEEDTQCGTTHCRAGWAIHLAGDAGYDLEAEFGPEVAGALIYYVSTGSIPSFYGDNERALEDIRRCAAAAAK